MRVLIDRVTGSGPTIGDLSSEELHDLYAIPSGPWLRVNFVNTVDGAATGADGKSGTINNPADKRVFDLLRSEADVIVIGAGTASTEGYEPADQPIVVVTNRGTVPPTLTDAPSGSLLIATHGASPGLDAARAAVGAGNVLVLGDHTVDLVALKEALARRGFQNLLSEGGPTLFTQMLAAGVVDEVCTTTVPRLVAGDHVRIGHGMSVELSLQLRLLLEEEHSLIARWFTG
ncbi:MAG: dihydrofolate reductase family protein [Nocardioides sp.]|nr:dihydrofolate reductase family protein [Nocardioides sp.]